MRVPLVGRLPWRRAHPGSDRGVSVVLFVIVALVLFGFLASAVDIGRSYVERNQLQTASDSAALAAADAVQRGSSSCNPLDSGAIQEGRSIAESLVSANAPDSTMGDPETGEAGYAASCTTSAPKTIQTNITASTDMDTYFLGLFGLDTLHIVARSQATSGPVANPVGLRPFALCDGVADSILRASPGTGVTVSFDNKDGSCKGNAPGNWGVVDFDGGSNASGDTEEWVRNGYQQPAEDLPWEVAGNPGAPSPGLLEDALNSIVGSTIVLPVYPGSTVTTQGDVSIALPGGANALYPIGSYIGVRLCGWRLENKVGNDSALPGSCWNTASIQRDKDNIPKNFLQVAYEPNVSITGGIGDCGIGEPCDDGVRTVILEN